MLCTQQVPAVRWVCTFPLESIHGSQMLICGTGLVRQSQFNKSECLLKILIPGHQPQSQLSRSEVGTWNLVFFMSTPGDSEA